MGGMFGTTEPLGEKGLEVEPENREIIPQGLKPGNFLPA
jgi:hypothetical protein